MKELFSTQDILLLVKLIVAHLTGDFLLQHKSWVKSRMKLKVRSPYLYLHGGIQAILAYVFVALWNRVEIIPIMFVLHISIDLWKSYQPDKTRYFIIDQVLHIIVIAAIWFYLLNNSVFVRFINLLMHNLKFWTITMSYLVVIYPCGMVVAKITQRWRNSSMEKNREGLKKAGKWIGWIERIAILTFILFQQFEAIGFLIASKSIFRFAEIRKSKDRQEAEYILIGTVLSFVLAIFTGIIALYILKNF